LREITGSAQAAAKEDPIAAVAAVKAECPNDALALYELIRALNGQARLGETADTLCRYLLFVYDVATDELVARHSAGSAAPALEGVRVPLGQRLSGWVAANRQIIVNSDPALDLYDVARVAKPPLKSALGVPLLADNQLVAVLTLYSPFVEAFTDQHRRMMQAISRQVAVHVREAVAFEASTVVDELTDYRSSRPSSRWSDRAGRSILRPVPMRRSCGSRWPSWLRSISKTVQRPAMPLCGT
jgi:putative methionine-R-sulfoxide reductase with GAF domain